VQAMRVRATHASVREATRALICVPNRATVSPIILTEILRAVQHGVTQAPTLTRPLVNASVVHGVVAQ
jgi:hypothetical protein